MNKHDNTISARVQSALQDFPQLARDILMAGELSYIEAPRVQQLCEQLGLDRSALGLRLLPLAAGFAEAPISHFHVGAVAFDSAGNAYLGANFEFRDSHIGQSIHAEQSAIAHAWACGAFDLALLVINYAPCGHCRQFINEVNLAEDFRILLPEQPAQSLATFLPHAFGPADLGVEQRLLGQSALPENITENASDDELLALAQAACERSHAPYSKAQSGVALRFADGDCVAGSYGENAAFNPSLPALQMALNSRRLQGKDWQTITEAVMVEHAANLSQRHNAEALLQVINSAASWRFFEVQ
ncbi:MAG: cytidine deaminase [Gammaproteobacteria bacterium]|nr:MAG: cytidine deaminase [Gammaproteobacteria bacterium]